jgi:hypothetical protein
VKAQSRFVAVLMEVGNFQPAAGGDPRPGVNVELQDCAIAQSDDVLTSAKATAK